MKKLFNHNVMVTNGLCVLLTIPYCIALFAQHINEEKKQVLIIRDTVQLFTKCCVLGKST